MRRFLTVAIGLLAAAPLAAQAPGGASLHPGKQSGGNFSGDNRRYQPLPPKPPAGKNADLDGKLNLAMGMPAPAGKDQKAYLLAPPQLALSYNDATRSPNWVAWHLNRNSLPRGGYKRQPIFTPDPTLPKAFVPVAQQDYNVFRDGFDRGHMVPAADRSLTDADNQMVFRMTNIVPQAPNNNQLGWERFERHCRDLAKDGWELFIVAGPWGQGGTGSQGPRDRIGRAQVQVPKQVWKVVLMTHPGVVDPTKVTAKNARAIALLTPNDQTVAEDWTKYEVEVADVEKLTGYRFFPNVAPDVAKALKGTAGAKHAPPAKKPHAPLLKGGAGS